MNTVGQPMIDDLDAVAKAINEESFNNWDEQFGRPMAQSLAKAAARELLARMKDRARQELWWVSDFLDQYAKEQGLS